MPLFTFADRLFHRAPTFDFGTGPGSLQRTTDAVNVALKAGDETKLRDIWEYLDKVTSRETSDVLESTKPIFAGRVLGIFLNSKERFGEAETILVRVKARRKGSLFELVEARFCLADAIWGQGERDRAERDALIWIEKLLAGRTDDWPNSKHFAKLAQYRYDFESYARQSEKAFQTPTESKHQAQIEENQVNAQLHLKSALAWHEAGRYTPALEHIAAIYRCNPSAEHRMMALNLEFFWSTARGREKRVQEIMEEMASVAQNTDANSKIGVRLTRTLAHYAQWQGDLFGSDALLDSIGAESETGDAQTTLQARVENLVLRGEWEKARQLYRQKELAASKPTRHGSRYMAITAMGKAYLELGANYCGEAADLEQSQQDLMRAALYMRGDRKLSLWIEALQMALEASQAADKHGGRSIARADSIAARFDEWDDSPDTQNTLAPLLLGTYALVEEWEKSAQWGEKCLEMSHKPVFWTAHAQKLSNAYEALGDAEKARALRQQVVDSELPTVAVALARRQLGISA